MRPVLAPIRWAAGLVVVCAMGLALRATPAVAQGFCVGDCSDNNEVLVNELIICVNIALGAPVDTCTHCDANGDGMVVINELIQAVNNALSGCGGVVTPTTPPVGETPTAE